MNKKIIYLIKLLFQTAFIYLIIRNIVTDGTQINKILTSIIIVQIAFDIMTDSKELFTFNNKEKFSDSPSPINNNQINNKLTEKEKNIKKLIEELKNPGKKLNNGIYHLVTSDNEYYIFNNNESFKVSFNGTRINFKNNEYVINDKEDVYYLVNDYSKNNFIKITGENKMIHNKTDKILYFIANEIREKYLNEIVTKKKKKINEMKEKSEKIKENNETKVNMFKKENNIEGNQYNKLYPEDHIAIKPKKLDKLGKNMKKMTNSNSDKREDQHFFRINAQDKKKSKDELLKRVPSEPWYRNQDEVLRDFGSISTCKKTKYKDLEPAYGLPFSNV